MAFLQKARRAYKKSGLKKTYRKVRTMAKKRYSNRSNIAKDVAMLKHLVNIEKKRVDKTLTVPQPFARSNLGADGAYHIVITPIIVQGIAGDERIGNSVKLVSGCLDVSITQQSNAINSNKIKLMLVCRQENAAGYASAATLNQLLEVNPFTGRRDFYSNRDPEYFSEFRIIKTVTMILGQDTITGGEVRIQKKIPLKFNHHLKFNTDGSNVTTKNEFYLIATASDGEMGTPSFTGAQIAFNMRWYFTDN